MIKTKSGWFIPALIAGSLVISFPLGLHAQGNFKKINIENEQKSHKVIFGQASFYANKFHGRITANGETFSQDKLTAACNVLPLGTWIKVTNLKNGNAIIVRTNDRLHPKTRRPDRLNKEWGKATWIYQARTYQG